jgi:hypothetical protein
MVTSCQQNEALDTQNSSMTINLSEEDVNNHQEDYSMNTMMRQKQVI